MKFFIDISVLRRNRNYCLLYLGQSISFFGIMMTSVALPYQIYHETHSTLMVGLLSLAQLLPLLVTALLGGTIADRYNRRRLILISEILLVLSIFILAFNASFTHPRLILLFIVSAFSSAITGLHRPAMTSMVQQIVPKEDFAMVGALNGLSFSTAAVVGPAIGGLVIAHLGLMSSYLFNAITFLISLFALIAMQSVPNPDYHQEESTWTSLKQGLKFAASRQELLGTYYVDFIAMVFGMPTALFPALAQQFGGVRVLGLLYAAPAAGMLVFSLFTGWCKHIKRYGMAVAISAVLWGLAIVGFGLVGELGWALFFLVLAGGFDGLSGIFRSMLWNESIPNNYRGRLAGIEMLSYLSGPKLGDTEAGLVAAAFGITASIVSGGVLCIVGVAICSYYMPKFWKYHSDQPNSI